MKSTVKAALITGACTLVVGFFGGKSTINNIITISADGQSIKLNDKDIQKMISENEELRSDNQKYKNQVDQLISKIGQSDEELSEVPAIEFKDIGLSINGDEQPVNKIKSFVAVNGTQYISKEFVDALIDQDETVTIKNGMLYIGKIVAEKEKLTDQWVSDAVAMKIVDNAIDSYGNNYSQVVYPLSKHNCKMIFNVDGKYSMLKGTIAMEEKGNRDAKGYVEILADGISVYKSPELNLMTSAFDFDIPINNATLLTVSYSTTNSYLKCIIADTILYNQE